MSDDESPIECQMCGDAITGVRPIDVMYTIGYPGGSEHTEFVCDDCADRFNLD